MEYRKTRKFRGAGIELNCVDYGGEGGPPILLVHGGAAHARWWDFVAPGLVGHFHVLALDQRGHGDSPWTGQWAYGSRHYAADLEAVIDGWGLGAPVLVGHSMGGHSVMVYAAPTVNDCVRWSRSTRYRHIPSTLLRRWARSPTVQLRCTNR